MRYKSLRHKKTKKYVVVAFLENDDNTADLLEMDIPTLYPVDMTEQELKDSYFEGLENVDDLIKDLNDNYEAVILEVNEPSGHYSRMNVLDFARHYHEEKTNGNDKIASVILKDWVLENKK